MLEQMKPPTAGIRRLDVVLAVVFSLLGVFLMVGNVQGIEDANDGDLNIIAVPLFLGVTLSLAWRRVAPLGALAVAVGALLVHMALFHDVVRCGVAFPVLLLLIFAVAARLDLSRASAGLVIGLAGGVAVTLADPVLAGVSDIAFIAPLMAVVWGVGRVVHARGLLAGDLEARTNELRVARDDRARLEVATDRARLSGELDELLQRRLGELAHLAGEGPRLGDTAHTTATLVDIERQSRRTLEEMRELVGVLRDDASDVTAPHPTLTHLDGLLVRAKGAGASLTVEGNPRTLPAGVELSAYRIVEHLLAALDDSADVDVRVRFADDGLEIAVSGPSRRRAEAAIERARERVQLHHGTLETTTRDGRAEAIASLPVLAGV